MGWSGWWPWGQGRTPPNEERSGGTDQPGPDVVSHSAGLRGRDHGGEHVLEEARDQELPVLDAVGGAVGLVGSY